MTNRDRSGGTEFLLSFILCRRHLIIRYQFDTYACSVFLDEQCVDAR